MHLLPFSLLGTILFQGLPLRPICHHIGPPLLPLRFRKDSFRHSENNFFLIKHEAKMIRNTATFKLWTGMHHKTGRTCLKRRYTPITNNLCYWRVHILQHSGRERPGLNGQIHSLSLTWDRLVYIMHDPFPSTFLHFAIQCYIL